MFVLVFKSTAHWPSNPLQSFETAESTSLNAHFWQPQNYSIQFRDRHFGETSWTECILQLSRHGSKQFLQWSKFLEPRLMEPEPCLSGCMTIFHGLRDQHIFEIGHLSGTIARSVLSSARNNIFPWWFYIPLQTIFGVLPAANMIQILPCNAAERHWLTRTNWNLLKTINALQALG